MSESKNPKRHIVFAVQDFNGGSFPTNVIGRVTIDSPLTFLEAFEKVVVHLREKITAKQTNETKP